MATIQTIYNIYINIDCLYNFKFPVKILIQLIFLKLQYLVILYYYDENVNINII